MAEKRFSFRKFLGLAFAVSLVVLIIWQAEIATDNSTYKINQKVESIGGTVLSIDMKGILEDTPFFRGKHTVVFEFKYMLYGEPKTGWLEDGFWDKWILDYQK